ncbi:hypothetical protein IVB46_04125 [Bradyrhizobium sp. 61]|uniref:hypothetical protein n=1 Tax=unclassified Bradyrhizobium TaxID=2631580 RepID=UPI001FFC29C9|nr:MULTISPECIES: hypothetical protein [unclassified Bradyrhizobium]MCK1274429.1 hypothetical protein [Bradyrhizobium sp. 61]MCK1459827.1 hypothetical protein [Bradyrhizobium sp. 2]
MRTIDDDKKDYMREHLHYEIEMLRFTHDRLKSISSQMLANALMESFVVHARNLMDFFYNQLDPKCFSAADFLPTGDPAAQKASFGDAGKAYGLVHNQTLHLGQRRPTLDKDKVGPDERQTLRDAIESQIPAFEAALLSDYKTIWDETKRRSEAEKKRQAEMLQFSSGTPTATGASHGVTGPDDPNRSRLK